MSRFPEMLPTNPMTISPRAGVSVIMLAMLSFVTSMMVFPADTVAQQQRPAAQAQKQDAPKRTGLGRPALPEEIKAWDIDVRPDGLGLPEGKGSVKQGEQIYLQQCAACHGDFGEGAGRWPVLAGGRGSLKADNPEKTLGSFWPYASTSYDYIRRSMPFGNARSLTDDEVYAVVAFLLHMNDLVPETFELSKQNFTSVKLPNADGFYDDDREKTERAFWKKDPCMKNCQPGKAEVTMRARVLDVTPDSKTAPKVD